jgi:hypothetical protein
MSSRLRTRWLCFGLRQAPARRCAQDGQDQLLVFDVAAKTQRATSVSRRSMQWLAKPLLHNSSCYYLGGGS